MNGPKPTLTASKNNAAVLAGDYCPETGWWHPLQSDELGSASPSRFIGKGSLLPTVDGIWTFWVPSSNAFRQSDY